MTRFKVDSFLNKCTVLRGPEEDVDYILCSSKRIHVQFEKLHAISLNCGK